MDEFEFGGKTYVAKEYFENDCGCLGGVNCAFDRMSAQQCRMFSCTPDERLDGRNVIFVEKQP